MFLKMDREEMNIVFTIPKIAKLFLNKGNICLKPDNTNEAHTKQFQLLLVFKAPKYVDIKFLPSLPIFIINTTLSVSMNGKNSWSKIMNKAYDMPIGHEWVDLTTVPKRIFKNKAYFESHIGPIHLKLKIISEIIYTPQPRLGVDLNKLLQNNIYSDASIISQDGEVFTVHKAVLASRSEVFQAMLAHDTVEAQTNSLKTHLDSAVLREVLTYIYTDDCPSVDGMAAELLAAADYYQLNRLKTLSQRALLSKLAANNAIEILEISDKYSAEELKQYVLKYIIRNGQMKDILKSEQWKKTRSLGLVKTMLEMYVYEHDHLTKTN